MDRVLRDRLTAADITVYQRDRVERLLAEVDRLLMAIMSRFESETKQHLVELAAYEAEFEAKALGQVATFEAVIPAVEQIRAAVLAVPMSVRGAGGGKLLEPFISTWARNEVVAVSDAIRRGYFEGRTTQQIIQEIRGTKARKYADGLLSLTSRHAEAIVRTSVQHVASVARMETWKANEDIVTGYRWVSTLDGRTSQQCRSLDGKVFKTGKGPVPPIHINCRSSTVAELDSRYSWLKKGATRASKDGYVDGSQTYYEWLKKQPARFQDEAIGPTRGKLLRNGGLTAERFAELNLGKNFQPLTLDEMRRLEPAAFEKANL